jgi:hypothetical protein
MLYPNGHAFIADRMESTMSSDRYLIGIWAGSLLDAAHLVNEHMIADRVIQFVPDKPHGFWIMLRVSADMHEDLRKTGSEARPRWSFLP